MLKRFALAAAAAGILAAGSAHATVLLDDGFDGVPAGSQLNYLGFANWDVQNGSVDRIASGSYSIFCDAGSSHCVDLDGTSNGADLVSKTAFSFNAGDVITLSFAFSGNQRNSSVDTLVVSLGGFYSETFANVAGNQAMQTITRSFSAGSGGSAKLMFSDLGADSVGIVLDSVKLEADASKVPVPLPLVLMGSAVALAVWRARRAA